jgi:YjbE family integral membrane protein
MSVRRTFDGPNGSSGVIFNLKACGIRPKQSFSIGRFGVSMDFFTPTYLLAVGQIIWIDLLLSGDNAVVIAMACRSLPDNQRRTGIFLGAGAAIGLRIVFAFIITQILGVPFLKVLGGVLLVWIAVKLIVGEETEGKEIASTNHLWKAVGTIAVADAVMSLDNVVAIAAIAREDYSLFIFGLALSVPLIVVGASVITSIITRYPIFVWAGAALLGWIAGDMMISDTAAFAKLGINVPDGLHYVAATAGAAVVLALGYVFKRKV